MTAKTGGLTLNSLVGSGAITGDKLVTVNTTFAPGHSIGAITHAGDFTLGSTSTTTMEIDVAANQFDTLAVADVLTYGGTLNVVLSNVTTSGVFDIFDFASVLAGFDGVTITGHDSNLYDATFDDATGQVTVTALSSTAVPEPNAFATVLLCGAMCWALAWRKRR